MQEEGNMVIRVARKRGLPDNSLLFTKVASRYRFPYNSIVSNDSQSFIVKVHNEIKRVKNNDE